MLEIGFGNGAFIEDIVQQIEPGIYTGIDLSETMVRLAQRRNSARIRLNKIQLLKGTANALPYADNSFNKVFTVNTIYFWENPLLVLAEVKRVLLPEGIFVIALATRDAMKDNEYAQENFKLYDKYEVEELFSIAGFTNILSIYKNLKFEDVLCVRAERS